MMLCLLQKLLTCRYRDQHRSWLFCHQRSMSSCCHELVLWGAWSHLNHKTHMVITCHHFMLTTPHQQHNCRSSSDWAKNSWVRMGWAGVLAVSTQHRFLTQDLIKTNYKLLKAVNSISFWKWTKSSFETWTFTLRLGLFINSGTPN